MCNQFTLHLKFRIDSGRTKFQNRQTVIFKVVNPLLENHQDRAELDLFFSWTNGEVCAGSRSADENGTKPHTTTATQARRSESRVRPHETEEFHQPHGRPGAAASSLPPAVQANSELHRRRHACSARLRSSLFSPRARALASWDRKLRASYDHLPPTSTVRTSSLARARRLTSSG